MSSIQHDQYCGPFNSKPHRISRQPTLGRNICISCKASNLSRIGINRCSTCGFGFKNPIQCRKCEYIYGDDLHYCPHCH